jgi:hypothetical protein
MEMDEPDPEAKIPFAPKALVVTDPPEIMMTPAEFASIPALIPYWLLLLAF